MIPCKDLVEIARRGTTLIANLGNIMQKLPHNISRVQTYATNPNILTETLQGEPLSEHVVTGMLDFIKVISYTHVTKKDYIKKYLTRQYPNATAVIHGFFDVYIRLSPDDYSQLYLPVAEEMPNDIDYITISYVTSAYLLTLLKEPNKQNIITTTTVPFNAHEYGVLVSVLGQSINIYITLVR